MFADGAFHVKTHLVLSVPTLAVPVEVCCIYSLVCPLTVPVTLLVLDVVLVKVPAGLLLLSKQVTSKPNFTFPVCLKVNSMV